MRKPRVKSDSTIRRHLKELRRLIDEPSTDVMTRRIAYEVETAIRWAREPVVGWETPVQSVHGAVTLLRQELERVREGAP